jgi:hypothetical protein
LPGCCLVRLVTWRSLAAALGGSALGGPSPRTDPRKWVGIDRARELPKSSGLCRVRTHLGPGRRFSTFLRDGDSEKMMQWMRRSTLVVFALLAFAAGCGGSGSLPSADSVESSYQSALPAAAGAVVCVDGGEGLYSCVIGDGLHSDVSCDSSGQCWYTYTLPATGAEPPPDNRYYVPHEPGSPAEDVSGSFDIADS